MDFYKFKMFYLLSEARNIKIFKYSIKYNDDVFIWCETKFPFVKLYL